MPWTGHPGAPLDQLPPVLQQREKAVLVQEELDPVPVFRVNETFGVALGIDEEILALFQNLELTAFAACGKLGIMGHAAVNVIDQVIVRRKRLGNLGKGDILMLKLLPGKLRPDLFIDVFDADEDMRMLLRLSAKKSFPVAGTFSFL